MSRYFKFSLLVVVLASVVYLAGLNQASASSLLYDRGLPIYNTGLSAPSNLNDINFPDHAINPNRSNGAPFPPNQPYSLEPTSYQVSGDTFSLGSPGQTYHIDKVSVWMIFGGAGSQYGQTNPHTPTINMALWVGDAHGVEKVETAYTATRVWYSDSSNFQSGIDGVWRQIWQIDFAATSANRIQGGQTQEFFLDGLYQSGTGQWQVPALHVENSSLSNNLADGADGHYLLLQLTNGVAGEVTQYGSIGNLDANVQIYGTQVVPLPGTLLLLGSGLLGLAGLGRKFRKG